MKPATAYTILVIISSLMFILASGGIAFALVAEDNLSTLSYSMIFLTMVNAALFFIVGLNLKSKVEKGESNR